MTMTSHEKEVSIGKRFEFGKNWSRFLDILNDARIVDAENSLKKALDVDNLRGKSFLDIGSGSGLFSLAARRLGATVVSFDYDPQSVACTNELKRLYFNGDKKWVIEEGSVLDNEYLFRLGEFDIVYSWGTLHHTGDMWAALGNVDKNVRKGGKLFIALYNHQRFASTYWLFVKKTYNKYFLTKPLFIFVHFLYPVIPSMILKFLQGRRPSRGMNFWFDLLDWLGGYPFEVSTPKKILDYYTSKGYVLYKLNTVGEKLGCNEYIFSKKF